MKTLIYGYGNPGRQDDGLGPACVEVIGEWLKMQNLTNIEIDCNYQLNIEDAERISEIDKVIFVDATIEPIEDCLMTKVEPGNNYIEFTMHAVSPAYVLALCQKIFHKTPETYLLHIKGYEFELIEELTTKAKQNLEKAVEFLKKELM